MRLSESLARCAPRSYRSGCEVQLLAGICLALPPLAHYREVDAQGQVAAMG